MFIFLWVWSPCKKLESYDTPLCHFSNGGNKRKEKKNTKNSGLRHVSTKPSAQRRSDQFQNCSTNPSGRNSPFWLLSAQNRLLGGARGGPRNSFFIGILIFLLLRSPCKISKLSHKPFWEKRPSAQPSIGTSGNFPARVSAELILTNFPIFRTK